MEKEILIFFLAGGIGALLRDIVEDNKLKLPNLRSGELTLGFIGSVFIGAVAGMVIDSNPITAGLAGYAGMSAIKNFISKKNLAIEAEAETVEETIRRVANEEMVDPDLAVKVARCESNLNPKVVNINADGSQDKGLFQINNKWHPEVTDQEAFNIEASTRFFCKAFKAGHLDWWNATKECWSK